MSTFPPEAFTGVGTAMLTPFHSDGSLDLPALRRFTEFQIQGGVNFLVPCGTTGESVTMSPEEQMVVIRSVSEAAQGKLPILAGLGGNNTRDIAHKSIQFKDLGATHLLSVSPYYNKPTQEGIYQHYKAIFEASGLPIMLYNVQGRTSSNVEPETVARLFEEGIIFGVKEASGNIFQMQRTYQLTGDRFIMVSGDDAITQAMMAVGGKGVISVASNIVPRAMRNWVDAIAAGDMAKGRELAGPLLPLFSALFHESNPIPVKGAAAQMGLMENSFRLPMVPPSAATMEVVNRALAPFL